MKTMTLETAALDAARTVVVLEHFGWRIAWAAIARCGCGAYAPVASPEASDRLCPAFSVIWSALHRSPAPQEAVDALIEQDDGCFFYGGEHMDTPETAAFTLIAAVLEPRESLVRSIADVLKSMEPVHRSRLLRGWCGQMAHDPISELVRAANRDQKYIARLGDDEICC